MVKVGVSLALVAIVIIVIVNKKKKNKPEEVKEEKVMTENDLNLVKPKEENEVTEEVTEKNKEDVE